MAEPESINFVLSKGAKMPLKATVGAAGFDFFSLKREFFTYKDGELEIIDPKDAKPFDIVRYSTGVHCEIPK
jgi:hypothetical protein